MIISVGTEPIRPTLSTTFTFCGTTYHNRRPGFLFSFSDEQYVALYQHIHVLNENAAFPDWTKIMRDDNPHIANVFHNILKHIVSGGTPSIQDPELRLIDGARRVCGANS